MSDDKKIAMAEFRAERDRMCVDLGLAVGIKFAEDSLIMKAFLNEFLAVASLQSRAKDLPFSFDPATRHMWYLIFVSLINVIAKVDGESLSDPNDLDDETLNKLIIKNVAKNSYLAVFWKWVFGLREKAEKSFVGLADLSKCEKEICADDLPLLIAMTIFKDICEIIISELSKISKHEFSEKKLIVKVKRFATILSNIGSTDANPDTIDNLMNLCVVCAKVKPEKVKAEKPVKKAKAKKVD